MLNHKNFPLKILFYIVLVNLILVTTSQAQTVKSYNGRLNCKTLDQSLAQFPRLSVGRFCRNASEACEMQTLYMKLDASNPLKLILQDRLQDYLNLQLEICETAFAVNAPDYYSKYLSRTNPYAKSEKTFQSTEPITPTIIQSDTW